MGNAAKILMLLVCCGSGAALAVYVAASLDVADRPAVDGSASADTRSTDTARAEMRPADRGKLGEGSRASPESPSSHWAGAQSGAGRNLSAWSASPRRQNRTAEPATPQFNTAAAAPTQAAATSFATGAAMATAIMDVAQDELPHANVPHTLRPVSQEPRLIAVDIGGSKAGAMLRAVRSEVGESPGDEYEVSPPINAAPEQHSRPAGRETRRAYDPDAPSTSHVPARSSGDGHANDGKLARANQPHRIVRSPAPVSYSGDAGGGGVVSAVGLEVLEVADEPGSPHAASSARSRASAHQAAVHESAVRQTAAQETTASPESVPLSSPPDGARMAQGGLPLPSLPEGLSGELGTLLRAAQELSGNQAQGAQDGNHGQPNGGSGPGTSQPQRPAPPPGPSNRGELSIRRSDDLPAPRPASEGVPHQAGPAIDHTSGMHPPGPGGVREGDEHLEIYARNQEIRDVLALLGEQAGLNIVATRSVTGMVSVSLSNVSVEGALEAVLRSTGYIARRDGRIIYVGTPADFVEMEQAYDRVGTRVFRPYYVSAQELQVLITPLLTPNIGKISVNTPSGTGIGSNDNEVGGDSFTGGDTLLVQDRETVLREIEQVVREVDRAPMQVAIEAMILSVTLDDKYECGIDFQFLRNQGTIRFGIGSPPASVDGVNFDAGGLKFAYLDSSLGAFIKALETIGDTSVIASPRVLVLNKQRAEVLIGGQLGYVNTTVTETTATQSVEFLEVGTQLRIRPFISPDGMIRMEVHPELSTGNVRIEQGLTLPDKQVTKVTSNVMVRDGSTVIIGGLMRDDLKSDAKQMPLMGNLPLLGKLFRTTADETKRTEIVVLLTPRIVCQDELAMEGDRAACEFHRRHATQADHMAEFSRDYLSEKYCHLAKQAYRQGNREQAWRYIQLAVEIKPANRAAIELRARMAAGVEPHLLDGPLPSEMPNAPPLEAGTDAHLVVPEELPPPGAQPHLHGPNLHSPNLHGPQLQYPPGPTMQGPENHGPDLLPGETRHRPAPRQSVRPMGGGAPQRGPGHVPTQKRGSGNGKAGSEVMPAWVLDELAE